MKHFRHNEDGVKGCQAYSREAVDSVFYALSGYDSHLALNKFINLIFGIAILLFLCIQMSITRF